jgi:SAM-dependent methyltransferase
VSTPSEPRDSKGRSNDALFAAVPADARQILEVGWDEGASRVVVQTGQQRLPVSEADFDEQDPPLPEGTFDCVVYNDVLQRLRDPLRLLRRQRRLLRPGGIILCSAPNVQHHAVLTALLTGDGEYSEGRLLDNAWLRSFSYSTLFKLLLDAGFVPRIRTSIQTPASAERLAAMQPLLRHLGLESRRTAHYLNVCQYIIEGKHTAEIETVEAAPPLSFVACVSDDDILRANLFSSPCLRPGSPHEVLLFRGCRSAAEGLNRGLARATHAPVICLHQDVYLPEGWPERFWQQYREAERRFGRLGVVGIYGIAGGNGPAQRVGRVVDRDRLLCEPPPLPARVDTLDELLLAVPRELQSSVDPQLGFHMYGADLCLAAQARGMANVAIDAVCLHNSRSAGLPASFAPSVAAFIAKWRHALPVATSCVKIDADGVVQEW